MLVTGIEEVGKNRCRICLEEGQSFVLYKGELSRYGIRQGQELAGETFQEILEEVLVKRSRLRCMNLLKSMDRTESQLREKLALGGYPSQVIDQAIAYVKGYGYVDDERYAKQYLECYRGRKSRQQMRQELRRRGISGELIRMAEEEAEPADEKAMIRRWIVKKKIDLNKAEPSDIRKLYMFLMRKGFASGDIGKVLKETEDFHETDTFT